MKNKEGLHREAYDVLPEAEVREAWIAVLDKVIAGLMFAIVVTLCVPLCSLFYR